MRMTQRVVKIQTGYVYHYAFAMLLGVAGRKLADVGSGNCEGGN